MRKKTEDYTIEELLEMGARIDVNFHDNSNLQDAYNKVKPFTDTSSIEKCSYDGAVWVQVGKRNLQISSFL